MKITRRKALARGGQAVAVAAAFPIAGVSVEADAVEGDAELFAAIASLKRLMGEYLKARAEADAAYEKAEADPDQPPPRPNYDVVMAHRERFGWREPYERWCSLSEQGRKAAKRIFALPARTLKGALAKLQLANWLRPALQYPDDWAAHGEWEVACQNDFERLVGRA